MPAIAKLARTFLQCLAKVHYVPEAVAVVVSEFKLALARALALPESQLKHLRIRAITGLMSQILESQNVYPRGAVNLTHFARLLVRKGFISDLSRALHSLNLNSNQLPVTVNHVLKPLEVLTKIVNVASSQRKTTETADKGKPSSAVMAGAGSHTAAAVVGAAGTQLGTAERTESGSGSGGGGGQDASQPSHSAVQGSLATAAASISDSAQEAGQAAGIVTSASSSSERVELDHSSEEAMLEATHESLIPLEEEEPELPEGDDEGGVSMTDYLEEVVGLAHELGRQHARDGAAEMGMAAGMYVCLCVCVAFSDGAWHAGICIKKGV